jgi:hypothetical protein
LTDTSGSVLVDSTTRKTLDTEVAPKVIETLTIVFCPRIAALLSMIANTAAVATVGAGMKKKLNFVIEKVFLEPCILLSLPRVARTGDVSFQRVDPSLISFFFDLGPLFAGFWN